VTQDYSSPLRRLFQDVQTSLYAGTPYGKNGLGTQEGFARVIDAAKLRAFYNTWYHPNNAVLVIAGDVEGASTIAAVRGYFADFPAAKLPARPAVKLHPLKSKTISVDSDQPVTIVGLAFRFPGWDSKDYEATQVLESVLDNQRADLYGLVASGAVLYAGLEEIDSHAKASGALLVGVVPATAKPQVAIDAVRGAIERYKKDGVPPELIEVAKRRAVADAEYKANSIEDLAQSWSDAVAVEGKTSPDEDLAAIQAVTPADVNRVLRQYLDFDRMIVAEAVPKNLGKVSANPPPPPAKENAKVTILHHDPLPSWALAAFKNVQVPQASITPVDMTLANGMRLIVVPEHVSHTVVVSGNIDSNEAIQAPAEIQGVADITSSLLSFGTTAYDRIAFRKELDDIAAEVSAGTEFSLTSLSDRFDRAVALLADEELHPALPAAAFATIQQQRVQELQGVMSSPDYLFAVALNKALYPPGDPEQVTATPQSAGAVTLANLHTWYARAYRPDMATVVIVGDVTPEHAKTTFEKYFGQWKADGPKPSISLPAVPANKAADVVVPDASRIQSQVELVQTNGLARSDGDWPVIAVANAAFGASATSILFHDVRDVHGLVYGIYSRLDSRKNRGTFGIQFSSDPNKIDAAQSLAMGDLHGLLHGGVGADDLARGKTMLVSEVPIREQSFTGIAGQLLQYARLGLPLDQATIDAQREVAASNADIITAVNKWIRPGDFVRVILGPGPK
ncbi:MAG: insulinase family protein, partial [Candidatus Eremiobacteraeota bacterium]|nr:insulinase family protein [Candidatus Eremiobacteraeota bacterium]